MNDWFRQQEKEKQDRKIQELENRVREVERERDEYKQEKSKLWIQLEDKKVEFQNYKDAVINRVSDLKDELYTL